LTTVSATLKALLSAACPHTLALLLKEGNFMRTTFRALTFLALACPLFGASPFAGTWKLNVSESKFPVVQPSPKEETLIIQEDGDHGLVTLKGTQADGSPMSQKYTTSKAGGPIEFQEGAPPAGTTVRSKRIDDNTADLITMRDGKEVRVSHNAVSKDGKTLRVTAKGVTPQGKSYKQLAVFERQ
jgi:hypothetical protein